MKLISCDNCAVLLDQDKLHFAADIYTEEGCVDNAKAQYDHRTGEYSAFVPCPVCQEPVLKGSHAHR